MLKRKNKRVLSIVLAVAMIVGLFPIAAFADEGTSAPTTIYVDASATNDDATNNTYRTLAAAVNAASAGDIIELRTDVTLDGAEKGNNEGLVTIGKDLTLNGGNHSISATNVTVTDGNGPSMINIESGAKVIINNLTINGGTDTNFANGTKHGLNIYQAGMVTLNNVTVQNNRWYAVMNNGSALVVNGLTTSGNHWGINVDSKADNASIVVNNANIAEASSIVLEKSTDTAAEPAATINGGSLQYVIAQNNADPNGLTVNGGQFATGEGTAPTNAVTIKDHVAPGNTLNENGQVVIDATTAVASVKDVGYTSLQEAIDAAEKINGTVTLLKNIDLIDGVEISGTVTLDLNGFTISDSVEWKPGENVDYLLAVKRGGNLTINDNSANKAGAITTTNESIVVAVKLTIKDETDEDDAATLTVNGGTLKAPAYGISGNGTRHNTELTINGGTIEGTKGAGIYQPQDGTVTIKGGTITGPTGIEIRSGQLDVSGGTFISTAKKYEEDENGGGTTVTGAAIAVSQHTTKKDIKVTITGGTFRGQKAFVETNVQGKPKNIILAINGGTFESAVESKDITKFINGGHFALPVESTLLADTLNTKLTDADNDVAPYSYY